MPAPLFAYQHRADGLLTQVTANSQSHGFGYADSGLLTTRTNPFRALSIDSRDPTGRILQQTTSVGGFAAMAEAMAWRGDGTLNAYSVTRSGTGAWNESRAYGYNSRGQLLSEGFSPAAGLSDTLTYVFDGNTTRLGVRTDAKAGTGAPGAWEASATAIDTLARVTQDQINAPRRVLAASGLALGADHVDVLVDGVSQGRAVHPGWADPVGTWSMNLNPAAGTHTLTVNAVHPSHQYTATASSTFTVAQSQGGNVTVTSAYDTDGEVTGRTWDSGLAQTLTWDAFGRLIKVAQRDSTNNGYDWSAVYDGLGRRLKTTQQTVTANVASGAATVTTSIYDPQVEFLEIGVAVNGAKAWKVYGPDLNGRFGGLQGTGGLEATIVDAGGATKGVINDQFGNGVAAVSGGSISWFATRVGAYGPLPGTSAETLTDITRVAEATAWRSRRIDPTGFYCLGARYYEPTSGRFLSADPIGHAASPSLYDYASGDPVNRMDPDGRLASAFASLALDPFDAAALGDLYADVIALNNFNAQNSAPNSTGQYGPYRDGYRFAPGGTQSSQYALYATDPQTGTKTMMVSVDGGPIYAPSGYNAAANIALAQSEGPWHPFWFRSQVQGKGPWDYKQLGASYENLGNFNYGLTGAAFGFPGGVLLREAGAAQIAAGTSRPEWGSPGFASLGIGGSGSFGDDPRDQTMIRMGIDTYNRGYPITTERLPGPSGFTFPNPFWPPKF